MSAKSRAEWKRLGAALGSLAEEVEDALLLALNDAVFPLMSGHAPAQLVGEQLAERSFLAQQGQYGPVVESLAQQHRFVWEFTQAWEAFAESWQDEGGDPWAELREAVAQSRPQRPEEALAQLGALRLGAESAAGLSLWPLESLDVTEDHLLETALREVGERTGLAVPAAPLSRSPALALRPEAEAALEVARWLGESEAWARVFVRLSRWLL